MKMSDNYLRNCDIREREQIIETKEGIKKMLMLYQDLLDKNHTQDEALFIIAKIAYDANKKETI